MSASHEPDRCETCGAPHTACETAFHELLAIEHALPPAFGAVHHLTVAAYVLQHPAGYSTTMLDATRRLVRDALAGVATVRELRQQSDRTFGDGKRDGMRVRDRDAVVPDRWPRTWLLTAVDALPARGTDADAAGHIARVTAWAASVTATLDASVNPV